MANSVYDVLKTISLLVAPIGAFVVSMLSIWTSIDTMPIVATITALETLLGAILTISTHNYNKTVTGAN